MDGVDYFREEFEERFPGVEYPGPGFEYEFSHLAGTDDFGFAAFPAGQHSGGIATGLGYRSMFWSSTAHTMELPVTFPDQGGEVVIREEPVAPEEYENTIEVEVAYVHDINFGPGVRAFLSRSNGFPVRCVRGDLSAGEPRFRYDEP